MKKFTLAIAVMFVIAVSANAAVVVTSTSAPTVGLAGYMTHTVTATSDGGAINGIDGSFTGAMHQTTSISLASQYRGRMWHRTEPNVKSKQCKTP